MFCLKRFIPGFVRRCVHHYRIQKRFGNGNKIFTDTIAFDAKLGRGIYLAKKVDVRNRVEIMDNSYCSPGTVLFNGTKLENIVVLDIMFKLDVRNIPFAFFQHRLEFIGKAKHLSLLSGLKMIVEHL